MLSFTELLYVFNYMKVSIITVCYNSAATIEDTIKSVLSQTYQDVEYIIVDGASKDRTLEIIKKYEGKIAKIISEPDKGIYDAMNKGIHFATSEIIGIINSDDLYASPEVIKKVAGAFVQKDVDAVYGDLIYVDRNDTAKVVRSWPAGEFKQTKIRGGWIPPHPSLFVKRTVYDRCGRFNPELKIAADYEFMLRCITKGIRFSYVPEVFVKMREGGFSGRSLKQRMRGWQELRHAWRVNGRAIPPLFILRRLFSKITQYF